MNIDRIIEGSEGFGRIGGAIRERCKTPIARFGEVAGSRERVDLASSLEE